MAQSTTQAACARFRSGVSPEDAKLIEATTNIDDVKLALGQVERHLAARHQLRNMNRIRPFLDATERYSKVLEVAVNGTSYLPYLWGAIKTILQAVQMQIHALDKVLSIYSRIGLQMPEFSRFAETFPNDSSFVQLLGSFCIDVLDFHKGAYAMIRKSGWKTLFKFSWGTFHNRFNYFLENIATVSGVLTLTLMMVRKRGGSLTAQGLE